MAAPVSTCWTIIQGASAGNQIDKDHFARRYEPVIQAYLGKRWALSPLKNELPDAVQEVFLECFKNGGILHRVDPACAGGFRAFLYGVIRNVALRMETRKAKAREQQPASDVLDNVAESEASLSCVFDRAWADALLKEAAALQAEHAAQRGEDAVRRVELLRLRFQQDLPIREIAQRWQIDPAVLHHEYARARQEFKAALLEVVGFHHPGTPAEVAQTTAEMLATLA